MEAAAPGEARGGSPRSRSSSAAAAVTARSRRTRRRRPATAVTRKRCEPGEHTFRLPNRQAARMRVTPAGSGPRALVVVLHGAGGSSASALDAFRGGWDEPGLVLIAPAAKGQTWSILRSETDVDLESVNLALAAAYERCRIDRRRIAVGGFSDGATYALTLGVSNGDLFPAMHGAVARRDHRRRAAAASRASSSHTAPRTACSRSNGPATPSSRHSARPATRSPTAASAAATKRHRRRRTPPCAGSSRARPRLGASARRARSRRRRRR